MRHEVVNRIAECRDRKQRRLRMSSVDYLFVHRFDVAKILKVDPADANAVEACRVMQEHPEVAPVVGRENGYHILIEPRRIVQVLPLWEMGQHARKRYNPRSWAVAVLWDPRHAPMPSTMGFMLEQVCADLCTYLGGVEDILVGHDEMPGASGDSAKRCPGNYLPMDGLRSSVLSRMGRLESHPERGDEYQWLIDRGYEL
jgi:hypothetical protein